jgi:hypothetical protein
MGLGEPGPAKIVKPEGSAGTLHRGNRNADRAEVDRGKPVGAAVRIVELRACEWVELLHRQAKVWEEEYQTERNQAANYANSN